MNYLDPNGYVALSGETSYYYYTFDGSLESEYRTSSNGSLTHYIVTDSDGNTVEKTFVNGQTKTITTGTDKGAKNMKKIIQPISILLIITLLSAQYTLLLKVQ